MVVAKLGKPLNPGSVAAAATLATLPVGALLLFAAFFLGVGCGGALDGCHAIGGATDLLSHGAAQSCC